MAFQDLLVKLLLSVITITLGRYIWNHFDSPLRSFPGHWLSAYTNIWRLLLNYGRQMQVTQLELHRQYGPVVRMGPNIVSLSDPGLINTVFSTKKVWPKGEFYKPTDVVVDGRRISNLFGTRDEQFHRIAIKPVRGLYSMTTSVTLEPQVDRMLEHFTSTIDERFENGKKVVDLANYLPFFAWDSMSQMTVGKSYGLIEKGEDNEGIISTSTRGLDYFSVISQIPNLDFLLDKNPVCRIGPPSLTWATTFAYKVLAERKSENSTTAESREPDFLDHFLAIAKEQPSLVDDNMVVAYLLSNILAGSDTTGIYMLAAVYYVLKTPDVYSKLREEMDGARLPPGPVSWKDTQRLPYFDAVMREAARIHPGVGIMVERDVPPEGCTLPDGRYLPGGSVVGMNPWVVNRSEEYFGPETDKFVPERWLRQEGEDGAAFQGRRNQMKAGDLTFGSGARSCLGKNVAIFQAYKVVSTLFNTYEIELESPDHEWTVHNAWFMYQYDVPCRLKPRAQV